MSKSLLNDMDNQQYVVVCSVNGVELRRVENVGKVFKYCLYDTKSGSLIVDYDCYVPFAKKDEFLVSNRFYMLKRFCDRGYKLTVCDVEAANVNESIIINDWALVPYFGKTAINKLSIPMVKSPTDGKTRIFAPKLYGSVNDIFSLPISSYRPISENSIIITREGKMGYYVCNGDFIPIEYDEVRYGDGRIILRKDGVEELVTFEKGEIKKSSLGPANKIYFLEDPRSRARELDYRYLCIERGSMHYVYLCKYFWWNNQTEDVFKFQIQCDEVCDIAFNYREAGRLTSAGYCDFYYYSIIVKDGEVFKLLKIKVAKITTRFEKPNLTYPEFREQEIEVLVEKKAKEAYCDNDYLFLSDGKADFLYGLYNGRLIHTFPFRVEVKISTNGHGSKEFEYFTDVDSGTRYRPKVVDRKTEIAFVPRSLNCICNVVTSSGTVSISKYTKNALRKAVRAVVVKDKRNVFLDWKTSGNLPQVYSNWKKILNGQKRLIKSKKKWSVTPKN